MTVSRCGILCSKCDHKAQMNCKAITESELNNVDYGADDKVISWQQRLISLN